MEASVRSLDRYLLEFVVGSALGRRPYCALWRSWPVPGLPWSTFAPQPNQGRPIAQPVGEAWSCGPRCRPGSGFRVAAVCACGPELRDVGVDPPDVVEAGDGDAVVAVLDKVRVAELVQPHRRKVPALVEREIHALPPLAGARPERHEGAVEVLAASHAPHDLPRIDGSPSPGYPVERPEGFARLVERRQCVLRCGFSTETLRQTPQPRPAPRAAEVPVRLLVEVHQDHHSTPLSVLSVV